MQKNRRPIRNLRTMASSLIMMAAIKLHPDKLDLDEMWDQAEELFKINLWEFIFNEDFPEVDINIDPDW